MPYVIQRIIAGRRWYAVKSATLGPNVYTEPAHLGTQYATRADAARMCTDDERPVALIEILKPRRTAS